jgi:RNA polymerase sigma-70 factor (sigma-E family)
MTAARTAGAAGDAIGVPATALQVSDTCLQLPGASLQLAGPAVQLPSPALRLSGPAPAPPGTAPPRRETAPGRPETRAERTAAQDPATADVDADTSVTALYALYAAHYRSLVRLAVLLVRDVATAEEVVQDSFVAMHGRWRLLSDTDRALAYLRRSVVNGSRSVLRHRMVADRVTDKPAPDMPSAEQGAMVRIERTAVIAALRMLPPRQREVLVLRYYGDLSETQIASTMGISAGAVKSHAARAMASLRALLEQQV